VLLIATSGVHFIGDPKFVSQCDPGSPSIKAALKQFQPITPLSANNESHELKSKPKTSESRLFLYNNNNSKN